MGRKSAEPRFSLSNEKTVVSLCVCARAHVCVFAAGSSLNNQLIVINVIMYCLVSFIIHRVIISTLD